MEKTILYIHGKGGNAEEALHYRPLFDGCEVIGLDYASRTPWEAKEEFPKLFDALCRNAQPVEIIAGSIGAFFAMHAFSDRRIAKAYFISPIVDMETLIRDMMLWANVTEEELRVQKQIPTSFGETLSWEYLCYVRAHPIEWRVPTHILYGEKDHLTSFENMSRFANRINATLTVMRDGEHWFHTKEQMEYLDGWISRCQTR